MCQYSFFLFVLHSPVVEMWVLNLPIKWFGWSAQVAGRWECPHSVLGTAHECLWLAAQFWAWWSSNLPLAGAQPSCGYTVTPLLYVAIWRTLGFDPIEVWVYLCMCAHLFTQKACSVPKILWGKTNIDFPLLCTLHRCLFLSCQVGS